MATQVKENRTIVLPISEEIYESFMSDISFARQIIDDVYLKSPELFPSNFSETTYIFKGKERVSKKQGLQQRRIKIGTFIYRLRPSFMLPYMRATTTEVENALLLMRYGVPFWVISLVFGRNPMFWYRCFLCLADFNLTSTTVYNPSKMPFDLICDEFHTRIRGIRSYVATTIGGRCFLGAEVCGQADAMSLRGAYEVFRNEAQYVLKRYTPVSINTDGWTPTQNALKSLFDQTRIVECFLHAVIKIRDRATKALMPYYQKAMDSAWGIYQATSKRQIAQQIRRFEEWAKKEVPQSAFYENIIKLCQKKKKWMEHLEVPSAYRTSAKLDQIMKQMERHMINSQMFHGNIKSTTKNFRAFALLYNFTPSCPKVTKVHDQLTSPAARLNEFIYADSWLENLLIAASLNGYQT